MTPTPQLSVVVPVFNEQDNVGPLLREIVAARRGRVEFEAVFVDDNSRDGTAEEARRIGRSDPRVRVIQRIGRRGLASAANAVCFSLSRNPQVKSLGTCARSALIWCRM